MFDKALLGLPGIRRILASLALIACVKAAAIIGQAWLLAAAIANLWNGLAFATQIPLVTGFALCFLVRQIAAFLQDLLLARYAREQGARLRNELLDRAFTGSVGWVAEQGTAGVTTAALDGIAQVENYLRVILPKIIDAGIVVPVTLIATFILDWPSAIILAIIVPVLVFYMVLLGRMAQERATRQYGAYQRMSNHFIDTLRGLPTLKVLGAAKRQVARVFEVSERFRRATVSTLRVATLSGAVLDLLATLGVAAVAMMLGFRLVDGELDLFTGLAALMLAPEYFAPLRQFAGDFHASLDGKNALADILELTGGQGSPTSSARNPQIEPWGESSRLELRGIGFSYPPDKLHEQGYRALDGASLSACGFERIGIIGASGSGKSTLASLLGGFHKPDSGSICVDGQEVALDALQQDSWRKQVLYIPQNPYLFHATLRENICFYTPDASEAEIARAVKAVGLEALVQELPEGLETVIGSGGRGLSGGQAHRIALARALLDPARRILIFDEPTAHLDLETELELKERMLPLMQGRLVIFATHRHHWLADMDRVYSVEDGRLVQAPAQQAAGHGMASPGQASDSMASITPAACVAQGGQNAPDVASQGPGIRQARKDVWVRPYARKYRTQMAKALTLGIGAAAFAALLMFTAGYLICATAEVRGNILYYYIPVACVQLFGLGKPVLRYFERLNSHDWVFRTTSSLRVRLFKALERRGVSDRAEGAGKVLGLVAEDIGHIQNLYLRTMFPLVITWATIVLAALAVGAFDAVFAVAAFLLLTLVAAALPAGLARATREKTRNAKRLRDKLYDGLTDDMLGAADWVFSGRGASCRAHQSQRAAEAHDALDALDRIERTAILVTSTLLTGFACLMLWWTATRFGGNPIVAGMPAGPANWIAAFALGIFPLMENISLLPGSVMRANEHRVAIEHLNEFPEIDDSVDLLEDKPPAIDSHDIEASGLAFAYGNAERMVLDGIDLHIPTGQKLAILGQSGSGKTTFASLLRGDLAPSQGSVTLGHVATHTFGDAIASSIGVVQQDPYLFNSTLRDNLRLAKPDAGDGELWEVLERVHLASLVRSLPQGLSTMMGETGMRFSGGERHRIALARVLLADTPVILLDEPTVGLDPATEQALLDTLLETAGTKTLVMITHHLQGIASFDRVVFLENGHIELDGSPAELAATSERYRMLLTFDQ